MQKQIGLGVIFICVLGGFMMAGGLRDCAGLGWGRGLVLAVMSGFPMSFLLGSEGVDDFGLCG